MLLIPACSWTKQSPGTMSVVPACHTSLLSGSLVALARLSGCPGHKDLCCDLYLCVPCRCARRARIRPVLGQHMGVGHHRRWRGHPAAGCPVHHLHLLQTAQESSQGPPACRHLPLKSLSGQQHCAPTPEIYPAAARRALGSPPAAVHGQWHALWPVPVWQVVCTLKAWVAC